MPPQRKLATPSALRAGWGSLAQPSRAVLAAVVLHDAELADAGLAELAPEPTAVDPLVSAGWLREADPGRWSLHPAIDRGFMRELVPWSQRRLAHLALARVLRRERAQAPAAAAHLAAAGLREEAGRLWLEAAREHCRRHRHRAAAECFAQAIQHLPGDLDDRTLVDAVRDFGACAALQRDHETALELIRAWRESPALQERPAFQAEAARVHATLLARAQRHVESAGLRQRAAGYSAKAGAIAEAAAEEVAAATTLAYALHVSAAEDAAARAIAHAKAARRVDLQAEAALIRGFCLGMRGDTAAGRRQVEAGLTLALGAGLTAQAADAYRILGNVHEYASCYHDVPEAFARALSYCRRHGETEIAGLCLGCLSYSLFRAGSWRKSATLVRQLLAAPGTPPGSRFIAHWVLGLLQAFRGELKPAARNLARAMRGAREQGVAAAELLGLTGEALVHELAGSDADAAAAYRRLMELWLTTEDRHDVVPGFTGAVVFFADRGEAGAASEYASALQRLAAANPNPEHVGAATLAAAELKALEGSVAEAIAAYREAIRAYERRGLILEVLQARLRLARALLRAGETGEAEQELREVRARATRLGARSLAAAAAGLRAAPAPAGRPEPAGSIWNLLSPRQCDVARQLSAGRTNKEIAQALSLSVRTVDMHVAHLLARLDCHTRTAAVARLAALGAVGE